MCQKVTFEVTTNAQRFGAWLARYLQDEVWWFGDARFQTERGYIHLNEGPPQQNFGSGDYITIKGAYVERIQEQEVISGELFHFESEVNSRTVIDFELIDLASERLEVTAQCYESAVLEYFDEVLKQVIRRWPEAGEQKEIRAYFQERGIEQSPLPTSSAEDLLPVRLYKILKSRFDEEELRTLCFNLRIDYDDLRGKGKSGKARELVQNFQRRNALPCLKEAIVDSRQDISLNDLTGDLDPKCV
jgi:hypothetical protein